MIVVFMTIVMAVSLAFGMSFMTVGAADELTLGSVTLTNGSSVEIGCTQFTTGNDEDELNVNALSNVTLTTNGTTYNASHVRQIVSRKAFKVYFNGSGYNFANAVKGDLITVKAGTTFGKYTDITVSADINYIFTGSSWIKGTEVPTEAEALTLGDVSLTSGAQIEISSTQFAGGDEKELTNNGANNIVLTAADGEVYNPSHVRQMTAARKAFKLYFLNANSNGKKYSFDSAAKGDLLTIKKGLKITGNNVGNSYNLEVKEDINYIYTGSAWISGTELPAEAEEFVLGDVSVFYVAGTQIEIGCTMFSGKDEIDLTIENGDKIVITDTDGKTYVPSHYRQITSRKAFKLYFNGKGYSFDSAKRGDKLVVGAGFAVKGDYNYVVKSDVTYFYTGTGWVKASELPAEKEELKVNSITAGVGVSGQYKNDALIYVNTDSDNAADNGMDDVADLRSFVRYTFEGTPTVYGNVWFARLNKGEARFFVRQKTNASANMAVSDIVKGDKFTVKKGFSIGNAEVKADVTYIYNGNTWINEEDYIDYDKLTKNGIDTKEKTITLYKGDNFAIPELFYTYTTEVKVPEIVEADDIEVENAPDMNTVNEDGYTVTLKVGEFSLNLTVRVLATTDIKVEAINIQTNWNRIFVTIDTSNTGNDTSSHKEYVDYFEYYSGETKFTVDNYIILAKNYALDIKNAENESLLKNNTFSGKVGDILVVKKGLPFVGGERIKKTVTYVYNGTKFVELVEPETFDVKESSVRVFVNGVKNIEIVDDNAVTAVYKFVSANPEVATVNEYGVIKGKTVGTTKITVSYKTLSKEVEVTVTEEPKKTGIEIVTEIDSYYVPVSTTENPTSFLSMGYKLKARYIYEDGSHGDIFDVEDEWIGTVDYTSSGERDLEITIGEFKAVVNVTVYEYKKITSFTTLGVSGYDINDDRNQSGTWNGHMIIGMSSFSTSRGNMLSTDSSEIMSQYIVYKTADGKTYYGKADKENGIEDRIGVWQLGTNLLVMIKPEGSNANLGYADPDHWKSDSETEYVPIYKEGDTITFLKGMPIYAWKGMLGENNYPDYDKGCLIIEGYLEEDIVYYCYEEDGVKSLWQIYKEYTDFNVKSAITIAVGGTGNIGAIKTPVDATTGKFTYESSDTKVVTVTKDGNLVGLSIGTATVTVTLTGGKDADGNALDPIVKTVTVTVKKGINSVSGTITVTKGATIDLGNYEITVKYSDGTEEKIKLDASNVIVEEIDTSTVGTTDYNVRVTIDGETKRGTLTVTVQEAAKKGCFGGINGVAGIFAIGIAAAVVTLVRKGKKA